jgi:PKD repeat protein
MMRFLGMLVAILVVVSLPSSACATAPIANASGPYTGIIFTPLQFTASESWDPDGDRLTYSWDFGDGATASDEYPAHTYVATGTYTVSLTVSDGTSSATDVTSALIINTYEPVIFPAPGNDVVRIPTGRPELYLQIEPEKGTYEAWDVDPTSFSMTWPGGSASTIRATPVGTADRNHNGVLELTLSFRLADLIQLFASLPVGTNLCYVQIQGRHIQGNPIQGYLELWIMQKDASLALSLAPNPFNPSTTISFTTGQPGPVRVRIFDTQGRLVRTVLDVPMLGSGLHNLPLDGWNKEGRSPASGIYFVRVDSGSDGAAIGRLVVLK